MGMARRMLANQKGRQFDHVLIVDADESERTRLRRLLSEAKVAPLRISEAQAAVFERGMDQRHWVQLSLGDEDAIGIDDHPASVPR